MPDFDGTSAFPRSGGLNGLQRRCLHHVKRHSRFVHITEQICDTRPLEADVERFEQQIGAQLPRDYREFLMKYNGGRPEPSGFSFTTHQGLREDSSVHYFFGIHTGRIGSLERKLELRGQRFPTEFVSIATDPFGNLILMGVEKSNRGEICFWDHELEEASPSLNNISPVATSFAEFLHGLSDFSHGA